LSSRIIFRENLIGWTRTGREWQTHDNKKNNLYVIWKPQERDNLIEQVNCHVWKPTKTPWHIPIRHIHRWSRVTRVRYLPDRKYLYWLAAYGKSFSFRYILLISKTPISGTDKVSYSCNLACRVKVWKEILMIRQTWIEWITRHNSIQHHLLRLNCNSQSNKAFFRFCKIVECHRHI
jgi:hypothetical protein